MGLKDIFNASKIRSENERLHELLNGIDISNIIEVSKKIEQQKDLSEKAIKQREALQLDLLKLEKEIEAKKTKLIVLEEQALLEEFALYTPKFSFTTSEHYKNKLESNRQRQKQLIKDDKAVFANENWTVDGSKAEGKKMVTDMKKLLLRSFNNECDYCVDNVKFNNMESHEKRIEKSFEVLNKLGRIMQARISQEYKELKHSELYLAYEYQQKKQDEKEEQKRIREELREQQKLEQEIRQARERIAKERRHYLQAIKDLEQRLSSSTSEPMRMALIDKLSEVRSQFSELEKEERVVDYREKNAKAGYVYVISNIGAFGEGVYKIGMTRRLEPMDRIDELGDASVPFSFDVHALIFSENAPILESKLHERFYKSRINKLNYRKEFFRADIDEIEKIIREHYDNSVDIVKSAPAEEYRESIRID